MSILSCSFDVSTKKKIRDTNILSLSSVTPNDPSSIYLHGDASVSSNYVNKVHSLDDASSSSSHVPQKEYLADGSGKSCMNNIGSQNLHASPQNYVLRNLTASVVAERLAKRNWVSSQQTDYFWVGNGSLSGFDTTLSLPEIQVSSIMCCNYSITIFCGKWQVPLYCCCCCYCVSIAIIS